MPRSNPGLFANMLPPDDLTAIFHAHASSPWHHWGVMIPRMAAPFGFFDAVLSVGQPGLEFFERPEEVLRSPQNTVSLLTASYGAPPHHAFYARDRDCHEQPGGAGQPYQLRVGEHLELEGSYPSWRLVVRREGLRAELSIENLHNPPKVTWFSRLPFYVHLGLLSRYTGSVWLGEQRHEVSGPCSFEYAYGRSTHELPGIPRVPLRHFHYEVLSLDDGRQLLLADLRLFDRLPMARRGWLKGEGIKSQVFDGLQFTTQEMSPQTTLEGRVMQVPTRWTARSKDGALELAARLDGELLYGLGRGYIGGFSFEGRCRGEGIAGKGYLEYVDVS